MPDEVIKSVLTADDAEMQKVFARAAKTVEGYEAKLAESQKRSLSRATQEIAALRMEANGHEGVGAAIRQNLKLQEQAIGLARQAGISEQAALALLRERARLEQQVAAQRARGGGGPVSLGNLPGQNLQGIDAVNRAAAQARAAGEKMRAGYGHGAMGLLEVSRAAEDAQYGLRGVLNNIPGIVMSLGGGAGLAGAASIAAVAVTVLGTAYVKFLKSIDNNEGVKAQAKAWAEVYTQQRRVTEELVRATRLKEEMARMERDHTAAIERTVSVQATLADTEARRMSLRERERRLEDELAQAREKQAQAAGGTTGEGGDRVRGAARMEEDLRSQKKILADLNREFDRVDTERANRVTVYQAEIAAAKLEIEAVQAELAGAKANLAGAQAELKTKGLSDEATRNAAKNILASRKAVQEREKSIERLKAEQEVREKLLEQAKAAGAAGAAEINARIAASTDEIKLMEATIAQRKELNAILSDTAAIEVEKKAAEERKRLLEEQVRAEEKAARERERLAGEEKKRSSARADIAQEIAVLRLRVEGQKAMADALEKENRARDEARAIAERTGLSEAAALKLVKERDRLQKEAEQVEREGGRGGIRRSERDRLGGRVEIGGGRRVGLREHAERRAGFERSLRPREDGTAAMEKLLQRGLEFQEQLVKAFEGIEKY